MAIVINRIIKRMKVDLLSLREYPNQFRKGLLSVFIFFKNALRLTAI